MDLDDSMGSLVARLQREIAEEFPAWRIEREESGNWVAVRKGFPVVVAPSAVELRLSLRRPPGL